MRWRSRYDTAADERGHHHVGDRHLEGRVDANVVQLGSRERRGDTFTRGAHVMSITGLELPVPLDEQPVRSQMLRERGGHAVVVGDERER
ncbi:MAG: hypothetical protein HRT86_09430 [Ilumatobacteraceae bacterium]|nr:hypothetical protein [Ilumatobacteraceae bacterium]